MRLKGKLCGFTHTTNDNDVTKSAHGEGVCMRRRRALGAEFKEAKRPVYHQQYRANRGAKAVYSLINWLRSIEYLAILS